MKPEKLTFDYSVPKTLRVGINGDWHISSGLASVKDFISELAVHKDIARVTFDASGLSVWDSGLISFLFQVGRECKKRKISFEREGLPEGARKLISLALAVDDKVVPRIEEREPFFERVGGRVTGINAGLLSLLDFLGEIACAFGRLAAARAYFRRDEFMVIMQKCGAGALFLVSLISLLVGMILAFVGAIQLQMFGAQVFIADIVGIAMVRVMGAVMTGVLMSGRTGAAFAAELGIMQMNEEIDALKTLGVSPVEFLVLPRVMALVIMMPLLTIYSDLMGILGGLVVSAGMLDINPVEYLNRTQEAVKLSNFWIGLIHSLAFAVIIGVCGCFRGMKCRRDSAAVGAATTSAVVTAVTCIVIATAIITLICQVMGV